MTRTLPSGARVIPIDAARRPLDINRVAAGNAFVPPPPRAPAPLIGTPLAWVLLASSCSGAWLALGYVLAKVLA
ncbi:hypothetical protein [Zavarzinia sp. CC-PAN008]|uniref:hypothetical protein n=1 Tax=Zavarzinia sp. CC-PAN008 TaxID=3243332 RepID=UPI003F748210